MTNYKNRRSVILKSEQFELDSVIGQGGQGRIFSARNSADNSPVVIKQIDISDYMEKINFRNEMEVFKILKPLNLEYLCEIYDYAEKGDLGYIAMKRYNCDLFDFAIVKHGVSEELGKTLFRTIVKGIMNLHTAGIAHMDIKPDNIFLDNEQNTFIGDFGSCYVFKNNKRCCIRRGTKEYYPPEYAYQKSFDPRKVDVYCLGVTLYALLTGCYPYNFQDPIEFRVIDISDNLSPDCRNLLFKMLQEKPNKRISLKKVLKHPWLSETSTPSFKQTYCTVFTQKLKCF